MYQLNEKIRDLVPYDPIEGNYSIRLDANESCLQPPEDVRVRLMEAVSHVEWNRYPDASCKELCESFGKFYGVDPSLVTPGDGSDELISILCNAFLMPGETLVTAEPDFSMYRFYAAVSGARVAFYRKGEDLTIDPEAFIRFINDEKARMVIFSNPCNPTGQGLSREQVRKILRSTDALVVLDEAYMDFWDQSLLSEVSEYDNLLILRTCSKALGMASIRLGFAVANPTLTRALWAVKSPYNISSFTQALGAAVLREKEWAGKAISYILESREELYASLKQLEKQNPEKLQCFSTCTNFVFLKVPEGKRIFEALLQKGIAIRFMGEYLRISAGSKEENKQFLQAFQDVL